MKRLFAIFLALHGLIHLIGFAQGMFMARLEQLAQPISAPMGVIWLVAALLFMAAAVSLLIWPRWWWAVGAVAITVSMVAIVPSWSDAKFGAVANLVAVAGVIVGFRDFRRRNR